MFASPLTLFRALAFTEAVSWTLLIGGMILRASAGLDLAVTIGGAIHGFVFLAYAAVALLISRHQRWRLGPTVVAVGSAVIPYATIPTERWLSRSGRLAGPWRREATEDPRDAAWHDRLIRLLLRHPVALSAGLAVAVVGLYSTMLVIGPPGGR